MGIGGSVRREEDHHGCDTGHLGCVSFVAYAPSTDTTAFLAVTTDRYYRTSENVVELFLEELLSHATP